MKTVKEILQGARNLIAEKGWCQHRYFHEEAYCMLGALSYSSQHDDDNGYRGAKNAIYDVLGSTAPSLANWNDEPGRTKSEVLSVFDRAIARV